MGDHKIFDLIVQIGELMLKSGGEISRTKETMDRISRAYGIDSFNVFIIATGIFASALIGNKSYSAVIKYIPLSPIHLCRVEAINNLSREIDKGNCTPEQARDMLKEISTMTAVNNRSRVLASGVGSVCFCYIFGGSWIDCSVSFFSGLILYLFLLFVSEKTAMSKIATNIFAARS